ncbi:serine hydrolase domain-containing protein [Bacteroidota bacterium]
MIDKNSVSKFLWFNIVMITLSILVLCTITTTYSQDYNTSPVKEISTNYWQYSTPEEQGIDSELLAEMLQKIKDENLNIRSIIIIRNGHLVLESYVHPYNENVMHDVKSVSKSIISSIVGIALKEKIIESRNRKVIEFLPEYFPADANNLKKEISIANLLSMSSGLELDENGPIMSEIMSEEDWIKATFERPMISSPGAQFTYSTLLTHTMSLILTKSCGTDLLEFSNKYLFEPLGIKKFHWEKGPQGYYFGGDKLWITPQAMTKFGYLFLNEGKWENTQVVPKEWVEESTKSYFDEFSDSTYSGYGYWWWLGMGGSYHARGYGGQIISVYPDRDMVVVFTGADNYMWQKLTNDYIIPAVKMEGPLPSNPAAEKRIQKIAGELKLPESETTLPLPEIAQKISGRNYILQKNDLEFSEITLMFNETNVCNLFIKYGEATLDLAVGLDKVYRVTEKVKWGMKPNNNILALKGRWIDESKFTIDFQEVGEPFYFDVVLEFDKEKLKALFTWQPFGWEFKLQGTAD